MSKRFVDLVLGTDPRMRPRTRLTLLTDAIFLAWSLGGLWAWLMGLIEDQHYYVLAVVLVLPRLTFYPLIRSGRTLSRPDAALTQIQMVHANACIVFGYALIPDMRPALMQCMCLVQVFGLFTLRPARTLLMGVIAVGMLAALAVTAPLVGLPQYNPASETLLLATSAFIVTLLAMMSRRYAQMRVRTREEKNALSAVAERVQEQLVRDALTGLHNRQYMQEMIERERARAARGGPGYCVALIDLDHFKQINDSHGHYVGDEVLVAFARTTRQALRTTDLIARWGGEEFLVLMPDTDPAEHGIVAMERLQQAVAQTSLSESQPDLRVSFSAGVAGSQPTEPLQALIGRADRALYRAKAAGRKRCELAPPPRGLGEAGNAGQDDERTPYRHGAFDEEPDTAFG